LRRSTTGTGTNGTTGNTACSFIAAGNFNSGNTVTPVATPCLVNTSQPTDWTATAAQGGCPAW
jgi:hypothetical protein